MVVAISGAAISDEEDSKGRRLTAVVADALLGWLRGEARVLPSDRRRSASMYFRDSWRELRRGVDGTGGGGVDGGGLLGGGIGVFMLDTCGSGGQATRALERGQKRKTRLVLPPQFIISFNVSWFPMRQSLE